MKNLYLPLILCLGLFATETKATIVTLRIDSINQPFQQVTLSECDTLKVINNSGYTDYFWTDTNSLGYPDGNTQIWPDTMIGGWGQDTSYIALSYFSLLVITHQAWPTFYHVHITPCTTVGYGNVNNTTLNLYPNPTQDKLFINSDTEIESLMIASLNGQIVYQASLNNKSTTQVDVSHLPPGNYITMIANDKGILNRRITISR